jgi:hypothetical protein
MIRRPERPAGDEQQPVGLAPHRLPQSRPGGSERGRPRRWPLHRYRLRHEGGRRRLLGAKSERRRSPEAVSRKDRSPHASVGPVAHETGGHRVAEPGVRNGTVPIETARRLALSPAFLPGGVIAGELLSALLCAELGACVGPCACRFSASDRSARRPPGLPMRRRRFPLRTRLIGPGRRRPRVFRPFRARRTR